jgi:hypothetical protein
MMSIAETDHEVCHYRLLEIEENHSTRPLSLGRND